MAWNKYPEEKPEKGQIVEAIIEHWNTKGTRSIMLEYTSEDDNDFRTTDNQSELSHDWRVRAFRVSSVSVIAHSLGLKKPRKYTDVA